MEIPYGDGLPEMDEMDFGMDEKETVSI